MVARVGVSSRAVVSRWRKRRVRRQSEGGRSAGGGKGQHPAEQAFGEDGQDQLGADRGLGQTRLAGVDLSSPIRLFSRLKASSICQRRR